MHQEEPTSGIRKTPTIIESISKNKSQEYQERQNLKIQMSEVTSENWCKKTLNDRRQGLPATSLRVSQASLARQGQLYQSGLSDTSRRTEPWAKTILRRSAKGKWIHIQKCWNVSYNKIYIYIQYIYSVFSYLKQTIWGHWWGSGLYI